MGKVSCWYSGLQTHGETCGDCRHSDSCDIYTALAAARNGVRSAENDKAVLREDLRVNAEMLAKQCDLARQAEQERDELRKAVVYCGSEEMLKDFLDTYREKAPAQREDPK